MRSFHFEFHRTLLASLLLAAVAWPAFAESCHSELLCPNGTLPGGEFPNCTCDDAPPPAPEPPPPEPEPEPQPEPEPEPTPPEPEPPGGPPRCDVDFGCATGDQIGFGEWPECKCRDLETPIPVPGGPNPENPGLPPGAGMEDTCKMFFKCPPHYEMMVWNSQCVCGERMLEPPNP